MAKISSAAVAAVACSTLLGTCTAIVDTDGYSFGADPAMTGDAGPTDASLPSDSADAAPDSASPVPDTGPSILPDVGPGDLCLALGCQHGGRCVASGAGPRCDCTGTGYMGEHCESNVNECLSGATAACGAGATACVDSEGSYACNCLPGHLGDGTVHCTPSFVALGDLPGGDVASSVLAISQAGEVVVGFSSGSGGETPIRWTSAKGLEALPGTGTGRAEDVSPSGATIGGALDGAGVRWRTAEAQPEQVDKYVPPPDGGVVDGGVPDFAIRDVTVVLDDGSLWCSGWDRSAPYGDTACRITANGAFSKVSASRVHEADKAGHWAGYDWRGKYAVKQALVDGSLIPFATPSVLCSGPYFQCRSEAYDFSEGTTVVVGSMSIPEPGSSPTDVSARRYDYAFVYSASESVVLLPDLDDGTRASGAFTVSATGRVIGGYGTDTEGQRATLWIDRKVLLLERVFADAGGSLPPGWRLTEARAITPDGRFVAGTALNASGQREGFRLALPNL